MQRRKSNGQHCNVNPSDFGLVVNRFRYLVCRKGKVMGQTVHFVNASTIFDGINLGDCERQQFLDRFTYGDIHSAFTLIKRCTFCVFLYSFIDDCEDIYEKEVLSRALKFYNYNNLDRIDFINIEA